MAVHGFNVDVRADFGYLTREIGYLEQWVIPYATATALTRTAKDIRSEEYRVMGQVFDRPTRFTLNSLQVSPATAKDLQAKVDFKEGFNSSVPAWKYLGPQVEGGPRKHKVFEEALIRNGVMRKDEFAVPGLGVKLDAHGNVPSGTIVRILSQLAAAERAAGYAINMTSRSRKGAVKRAGGRYILLRPEPGPAGSRVFGRARAGIYLRTGARQIVPVLIFVGQPQYTKRYPYFATAQGVYLRVFPHHFRTAWQSTVRRRGARRAA